MIAKVCLFCPSFDSLIMRISVPVVVVFTQYDRLLRINKTEQEVKIVLEGCVASLIKACDYLKIKEPERPLWINVSSNQSTHSVRVRFLMKSSKLARSGMRTYKPLSISHARLFKKDCPVMHGLCGRWLREGAFRLKLKPQFREYSYFLVSTPHIQCNFEVQA